MREPEAQIGKPDSKMKRLSILPWLAFTFLTACASHVPPAPKTVESDAASTKNSPMTIQNPDGTFTVQKGSPKEQEAENGKAKKGLVIPPQVVVPEIPTAEKRN
jgi:hypothetical protein